MGLYRFIVDKGQFELTSCLVVQGRPAVFMFPRSWEESMLTLHAARFACSSANAPQTPTLQLLERQSDYTPTSKPRKSKTAELFAAPALAPVMPKVPLETCSVLT